MVLPRFRCAFVAREVGMVSSVVYRYFPSRDELLTALIFDAYWVAGERATNAGLESRGGDLMGRWLSIARAVRAWAIESPHEYALIFGTPIPGYVDPRDTVDPAAVIPALLLGLLVDATAQGCPVAWSERPIPKAVRVDLPNVRTAAAVPLTDEASIQGAMAWAQLIGMISFELFGHLANIIFDYDAHFDCQMRNVGLDLGFGRALVQRR